MMTCKLKALGITLVVVLLSAVGATAAYATPDSLEVDAPGALTVTGEHLPIEPAHKDHTFTLSSGRELTCKIALFDGTIEDGDTETTITPTYLDCTSNGTQPMTVTHNGCYYKLHGGNLETPASHTFKEGTVDLVCLPGGAIEIHVYSSHANHTAGMVLCTYDILPFTNRLGNTYENTTTGIDAVDVTTTIEGIAVRKTVGSVLVCGLENQTAVLTGATTLRAYSNSTHTNQVDMRMVDPTP